MIENPIVLHLQGNANWSGSFHHLVGMLVVAKGAELNDPLLRGRFAGERRCRILTRG